jgi:hypothetical protein
MAYSPQRHSTAEPQPKKKNGHHHEAHEEHEGRKLFFEIRCPVRNPVFVSFANFVVRKSFVGWRIRNSRPPKTFAQAAKTFKHSSTEAPRTKNPKHEGREFETISNDRNAQNSKAASFGFGVSDFSKWTFICLWVCFGFRYSDLGFD